MSRLTEIKTHGATFRMYDREGNIIRTVPETRYYYIMNDILTLYNVKDEEIYRGSAKEFHRFDLYTVSA